MARAAQVFFRDYLVLVMIAALVAITAIGRAQVPAPRNLINIMRQFGPLIMVSLGMTFVIIGGFIDLSVAGHHQPRGRGHHLADRAPRAGAGAPRRARHRRASAAPSTPSAILTSGALTQAEALFLTFGMSTVFSAFALLYSDGIDDALLGHHGEQVDVRGDRRREPWARSRSRS